MDAEMVYDDYGHNRAEMDGIMLIFGVLLALPFAFWGLIELICLIYDIRDKLQDAKKRPSAKKKKNDL